jgi:predicted dehydrogenase
MELLRTPALRQSGITSTQEVRRSIGWAVVSTGKHADTLVAPAIKAAEDTHLVAVYSREQERAEAFAGKHGAQIAYTSLEALMADSRVDVVFIASPNFLHAPYTKMAARRGRVSRSRGRVRYEAVDMVRMFVAWREAGDRIPPATSPGASRARRLIEEGVLGTITLARAVGCWHQRKAAIPNESFMKRDQDVAARWWHP